MGGTQQFDKGSLNELGDVINSLKQYEVFDYSDVISIVEAIDSSNDEIDQWKTNVINSIENVNEEEFHRLINILDHES